ncbi:MAG: hypothetical protein H6728_10890 [Myxococcales bacterium]|nr:hypothetical protein [Myxococcales bacterium]MCB9643566.1 hypothetical protein [Myxococcales bacterium]
MIKKVLFSLLALLFLLIGSLVFYMQGLSDLRTTYAKNHGASAASQKKGRALLLQSLEKMGGIKQWKKHKEKVVRIQFTDTWYGFIGQKLMMPLEKTGQKMSLLLRPAEEDARLTFLDGKKRKGLSWGLQQWVSYKVDQKGKIVWEKDEDVKFYVPTCRYFFYMPFYLAEAEKLTYAGEKELHGKKYDLVYATWKKWEPQYKIDQYLIWIRREDQRIQFVQFTVRDKINRITSPVSFSDFRKVDGLLIPFHLKILNQIGNPNGGMVHDFKIESIDLVQGDASKQLIPDPKRQSRK